MPDTNLRDFLMTRRGRLDPSAVGLPPSSTTRRRRGLRREEVAALAGVSVDYYARLEQGRVGNVSEQVLDAIATALRLDDLEHDHLRALVGSDRAKARVRPAQRPTARLGLRELVAGMDPIPAMIQSRNMDVLAVNDACKVLLTDFDAMPVHDRNIARWLFLDPTSRERYPDWEHVARTTVAALRAAYDPRFQDAEFERLVGELTVGSPEFCRWWSDYRLAKHTHGPKQVHHDAVGSMDLHYENFCVPGNEGLTLTIYTAAKGSPSDEKLRLLLSWTSTAQPELNRGDVQQH